MRIGTNHHSAGEGVVFKDNLVDDTGSGLPESDAVFVGNRGEEIIDLGTFCGCFRQVFTSARFGGNQVIAVNG